VTDQFPPEPGMKMPEGDDQPVEAATRQPGPPGRTPSLSIFKREAAATPASAPLPDAGSPAPPATGATPPVAGIGRLVRVPASALWTDNEAMASWLAATPAAMMDAASVDAATFEPPSGNIVLGTTKAGTPLCVVCEVGPSSDEGLGVLMRIAAVQAGGAVLWLTGEPGDAHIAALSWLNRSTLPRFSLVRVTGVRIDGSASAPIFSVVVRPARATDAPAATAGDAPAGDAPETDGTARRRRLEDHLPQS
jgi:hypothetical protein